MNKKKRPVILMYHAIGASNNSKVGAGLYSVSQNNFRAQMEYIVHRPSSIVHRQVLITFDDGDLTNYTTAYPILKELGITAYFFILVSKVGTPGYMNWQQLKELRDNGMIIGSHGMTHRILTTLKDEEIESELKDSKKILEDNLGFTIEYLSIPRGFCNENIIARAKEIGYKAIFTSNPKDNDGFRFGRIAVKRDWDLTYFTKVINGKFPLKYRVEELIKKSSKRILGIRNYDKIRSKILKKS